MDKEKVEVEIDHIGVYDGWIRIFWSGNIGFGQYDISFDKDGNIRAESEYMDDNEDKWFLKMLLDKIVEKVEVVS